MLYNGLLSGGGVGDYMSNELGWSPNLSGDSFLETGGILGRMFFDLAFFIIVLVLLLNIIFGIILDTFSNLRETAKEQLEQKQGRCFICGVDKNDIDEAFQKRGIGKGFEEQHVAHEHNMWDYLSFLMHLQHKDSTEYTGAETFVGNCVLDEDTSWVPTGAAMSLRLKQQDTVEDVIEQQGSALQQQMDALGKATQEQVARLQAQVEQVGTGSEEIAARVLKALREEFALLRQMEEDRDGKKKKRGSLGPSAAPPAAAAAPSITSPRREE